MYDLLLSKVCLAFICIVLRRAITSTAFR